MSRELLNNFEPLYDPSGEGGLYHHAEGSLPTTLTHLNSLAHKDPSCLWMAEEGYLYPLAITRYCIIPVSRFLLVKTQSSQETWKLGLEAVQTGLFDIAIFRPSQSCEASHWRRLQLASEKTKTRVFFVGHLTIPHWVLKHERNAHEKNALLPKPNLIRNVRGGLSFAYA